MSFLLAKKHSPRQRSVTAQGGTYLAKSKQIQHTRFFSSWQNLANKRALHKLTNILVITGSNISNSVGLWGVWSADASCGSFPFHSLPLSPQSAVRYRVIPGFTLLHNWRKRAVLLAAFKRSHRNRTARFHWHCTQKSEGMWLWIILPVQVFWLLMNMKHDYSLQVHIYNRGSCSAARLIPKYSPEVST